MKSTKKTFLQTIFITSAFVTIALAQSTDRFVYLKNSAGLLTGVIVHDNSFFSSIKINAFCASQYLSAGITCEAVDDTSPFAADPNKALRFVNKDPNVTPQILSQLQSSVSDVAKRLQTLTQPTPAPSTFSDVSAAAIPQQIEGSDLNALATSANDRSGTLQQQASQTVSVQNSVAPQFNSPVQQIPDISAMVASAVSLAVSKIVIPTPAPAQISPSQVIFHFSLELQMEHSMWVMVQEKINNQTKMHLLKT